MIQAAVSHFSLFPKRWIVVFFAVIISYATNFSATTADTLPALQHLTPGSRSEKKDSMCIYSLDSAHISSPLPRTILSGSTTPVTIVPHIRVDSVTIFVRHSRSVTDTLARISTPPYSTYWTYTNIPDQDQIHLQFGYILHRPEGKPIVSKGMPHTWAINRKRPRRNKTFHAKQVLPPDTVIINGKLDEWKKSSFMKLGTLGSFSFKWTNTTLCFAARINDTTITPADFVEIHLDPFRTRSTLSDIRHRSIRFGPSSRSYSFIAHPGVDSTMYTQCDSIAALITEGTVWRSVVTESGYIIEASLPFYAISDSDFPSLTSGMDVTCKTGSDPRSFVSWSGSGEYERYSPGNWGSLALHQAMFPLKVALFVGGTLFVIICGMIVTLIVYRFIHSERIEKRELKGNSRQLDTVQSYVDNTICNQNITVESIAQGSSIPTETIHAVLHNELDCTISQFIDSRRINRAKNDLWNFSLPLETVASNAGYQSVDDMEQHFNHYLHTKPASYRMQAEEMSANEESNTIESTKHPATTITTDTTS